MKARLSLKGRGVQLLAQREHSRLELKRKLLKHARADALAAAEAAARSIASREESGVGSATGGFRAADAACDSYTAFNAPADVEGEPGFHQASSAFLDEPRAGPGATAAALSPEEAVEAVLDWLQQHHYLSETRFVESRVHVRSQRYGNLRIRQELAQHGVALSAEDGLALKHSELQRAHDVWQRKFGGVAGDPTERARQMRFLSGRGFSPEVIRRVVRGDPLDD